jgi:hypothetical protein
LKSTSRRLRRRSILRANGYATSVRRILKLVYIVYTLIPEEFKDFVATAKDENEATYVMKKDIKVSTLPEFIHLLKKYVNFVK